MYTLLQIPIIDEEDIERADSLLKHNVEEKAHRLAAMTWEQRIDSILSDLGHVALKIGVVIVIFIVGRWLIRRLVKILNSVFVRRRVDRSLQTFVRGMTEIFLYLVLFYLMITWLGVNMSLFVALFAAAGLAIGMALSGVFQNFAGGVMILLLKPFKVGDWIEAQGQSGTVTDIKLFNTVLRTADNKTILIPNGGLATNVVSNYNVARIRRLEWTVSLAGGTSLERARGVLHELLAAETRIVPDPAPEVVLAKLNANSLDLVVHGWIDCADFWEVYYAMNAAIYKTIPARGLEFASSQSIDVAITEPAVVPASPPPIAGNKGGKPASSTPDTDTKIVVAETGAGLAPSLNSDSGGETDTDSQRSSDSVLPADNPST